VLLAGIIFGFIGLGYNVLGLRLFGMTKKHKIPPFFKLLPVFLIAGCAGLFIPLISYDGRDILNLLFSNPSGAAAVSNVNFLGTGGLGAVGLILVFQLVFSFLCFTSGAPGGNFFPIMVTGALAGAFIGAFCSRFLGMAPALVPTFMLIGMASVLTAVARLPLTAVVLTLEMTGSAALILPFAISALIAYLVPVLFRNPPLYASLQRYLPGEQG